MEKLLKDILNELKQIRREVEKSNTRLDNIEKQIKQIKK